jgi:hypothetical protein
MPIYKSSTCHFDCVIRVFESVLLVNHSFFGTNHLAPFLDTALYRPLFSAPLTLHTPMPSNLIALSWPVLLRSMALSNYILSIRYKLWARQKVSRKQFRSFHLRFVWARAKSLRVWQGARLIAGFLSSCSIAFNMILCCRLWLRYIR